MAHSISQTNTHPAPSTSAKQPRITAINLVRLFVISLVIATHIGASGPLYNSFFSGSVWMISHISRLLFVALTALVLTYNYGPSRPFNIKSFYLKRFSLVAIPYITWTIIYQLQDGLTQHSVVEFLQVLGNNLITGNAMYHLYFLLITMQLYLLFPLFRYLYGKIQQHPARVFVVSLLVQLVITALLQYGAPLPGLHWYWKHPENYFWTYQFYIVCGMLISSHVTKFANFLRTHFAAIARTAAVTVVVILGLYVLETSNHVSPDVASAVYQPLLVATSIIFGAFIFALGFRWVDRGERFGPIMSSIAENSFGIYLSHAFILVKLSTLQPDTQNFFVGLATLIIELPLVYATAFFFSELARRTPLSLYLTGRKQVAWRKPVKPTRVAPVTNF